MATIDKRPLKAYVRFDGTGRIVPSSLILRRKKPKVGKWIEIPAYECCEPTTTVVPPCVTYEISVGNETITLSYTDCEGGIVESEILGPATDTFCSIQNTVAVTGETAVVTQLGPCPLPTTTSTTTPFAPSDIRLKDNISATGGTIGGLPEYTWTWNATAVNLGLDHYPAKGVLAQEVLEKHPQFVVFDHSIGYLRVNYNNLLNA